jgi:cytochrome oxidase Cu insertion factor (SCO1/SenC/PrrC family)
MGMQDTTVARDGRLLDRRTALRAALLPAAAAALMGGCASRRVARLAEPSPEGGLGATRRAQDGTLVFRNHVLFDQDGRKVRFHDDLMHGRVFAATFGYMKCTGICNDIASTMIGGSRMLGGLMGNPIRFYHFSLAEDSPAEMREVMERNGIYGKPGWSYLTASAEVVKDIRYAFGFFERDESDEDLANHTGMARFGHHALDKWSSCPALGPHETVARSVIWLYPPCERPKVAGVPDRDPVNIRRDPNWTPVEPLRARPAVAVL